MTEKGFVNLTHVNSRKLEIKWDEEDLLNLLCRRIRQNRAFTEASGLDSASDREIFERVFPEQVDFGLRKPKTWVWIMRRIRDGNDIKPPRNLIDLARLTQQAQLRREDREARELSDAAIIEPDSLRKGLSQLSGDRVNDTLLAEAGIYSPLIEQFRGGKSEHNRATIAQTLPIPMDLVSSTTKPLVELGFLEEVGGTYKIPTLYREGLSITQGKAFSPDAVENEED